MNNTAEHIDILDTVPLSPIAEFNATAAGLSELTERISSKTYDCTTTTGDKEAREDRKLCVSIRTALKARHQELKAPVLERGRLLDGELKRITGIVEGLEAIPDKAIKAQEAIDEAAREERRKAEAERLAKIDKEITRISNLPLTYISASAPILRGVIQALSANTLEQFDTLHVLRAEEAKSESLAALNTLLKQRDAEEAARAEAEAQRAEQARLAAVEAAERAEQREAQRKADEEATAARKQADLDAQIARDAADRAAQAERDRQQQEAAAERGRIILEADARRVANEAAIADAHAELERQQAALKAEQDAIRAEREREAQEAHAREVAEHAQREIERINTATLLSAATAACELLVASGFGEHLVTRALWSAIAREGVVEKAAQRRAKRVAGVVA